MEAFIKPKSATDVALFKDRMTLAWLGYDNYKIIATDDFMRNIWFGHEWSSMEVVRFSWTQAKHWLESFMWIPVIMVTSYQKFNIPANN